jgi:hypothetical protein
MMMNDTGMIFGILSEVSKDPTFEEIMIVDSATTV